MTQTERIINNYDVTVTKLGFLAIRKKGTEKFITIAPSKTLNLYFLFGGRMENFQQLKKEKRAFKITGYSLYKKMFDENKFKELLKVWQDYKINKINKIGA